MPAFNLASFPSMGAGEGDDLTLMDWAGDEGSESPMPARWSWPAAADQHTRIR